MIIKALLFMFKEFEKTIINSSSPVDYNRLHNDDDDDMVTEFYDISISFFLHITCLSSKVVHTIQCKGLLAKKLG